MPYTTINKPSLYFNTVTYTGTGTTNNVTGVGFKPDFTWIKDRSNARDHQLVNAVVGYPSGTLISNTTDAEYTAFPRVDSSNADGFTVSTPTQVNGSGETYVAWNWLANNTSGSTNTAGTITSTVAANTTAGFSIVSYTGNLTNGATVGHGLGVAPDMMIVKRRSNADSWVVYSRAMSSNGDYYLYLNTTDEKSNLYNQFYDTAPTSSVFYLSNSNATNASGNTYINYCFASVKGYSKFGSYTGNGSTDGTFVYTGFKPAFVMWKRTDFANGWFIFDNKRNTFNPEDKYLLPYASDAEAALTALDFCSNGFKFRSSTAAFNASGGTFIYMAFAENPFVSSTFIPTTAR